MNTPKLRGAAATLVFAAATAATSLAQTDSITTLVREGDVLSNGWTVSFIQSHGIGDNGYWAATVRTTEAPFDANDALIDASGVIFAENDTLPDGEVVNTINNVSVGPGGAIGVLYTVDDPGGSAAKRSRVRLGGLPGVVVLRELDPVVAPGIPAGTTIDQIFDMDIAAPYVLASMDLRGPSGALNQALVRYEVTTTGVNVDVLALEGTTPGTLTGPIEIIYSDIAIAPDGAWIAPIGFDDGGTTESAVFRNGSTSYVDGQPGLFVNSTYNHAIYPDVDIAGASAWAATAQVAIPSTDVAVVLDRFGRVVQEGSGLTPFNSTVANFTYTDVAALADGRVVYPVPMNDGDVALAVDDQQIMRTDDVTDEGFQIVGISYNLRNIVQAAPSGRFITCRVTLEGGDDSIVLLDRSVGDTLTCSAVPNSTGVPGKLDGIGSSELSSNDLVLVAYDLPLNAFGYMGTSLTPGFAANPGGSSGNLCLGGAVGRYVDQIGSTGSDGFFLTVVDFTDIPQPTGSVSAMVGQVWGFQGWHRDAGPGGVATSNFTELLAVTLR